MSNNIHHIKRPPPAPLHREPGTPEVLHRWLSENFEFLQFSYYCGTPDWPQLHHMCARILPAISEDECRAAWYQVLREQRPHLVALLAEAAD